MKKSHLISFHKLGYPLSIENHRRTISAISKHFKVIIADKITYTLSPLLSRSQHVQVFRKGKSTLINLFEFMNHVSLGLRE